jgi:hypothetical protein
MNEMPTDPAGTTPPPPPPPLAGDDGATTAYPLQADIARQEEYSRFMPLVKWLLLIPHYIALAFLAIIALLGIVGAFFAVLVTGRYPRGIFDFVVGVSRWAWRVQAYLFLMVDKYPPFSLDGDPSYPATFDIAYPEDHARWRPLVQWFLAIPVYVVASALMYLAEIIVFFAFFTILFARKFPEGMFKLALIPMRWQARVNAYMGFLTTKYPPFAWE